MDLVVPTSVQHRWPHGLIYTLVAFNCNFRVRCVQAKFGVFNTLQTKYKPGSEKDQYLISERGLQVPSIIGHHEVQNQNKM